MSLTSRHRIIPRIKRAEWALLIEGLAGSTAQMLTWDALRAQPTTHQRLTLESAGNPVAGGYQRPATWEGVPLARVLSGLRPMSGADQLKLTGADGYQTAIPLALATHPAALLAYAVDGQPLSAAQGGPVRVILPDVYIYKQPQWLTQMAFISGGFAGFWESRGWPQDGRIQPRARIHGYDALGAGRVRITGDAFAGARPISSVALRIEGGPWLAADLGPTQPHLPTSWAFAWDFAAPGVYQLDARATDISGRQQPDHPADSFAVPPRPATTHHIIIEVKSV